MKVKVCGITNLEDARVALEFGADAIGFIFYSKSKRYIKPEEAKAIIDTLPFFVIKVGVFVNEEIDSVNSIAKNIGLNAVQLHGNENIEYCSQITHPVIKVFKVDDNFDYNSTNIFSDYQLMLDTNSPDHGGSGLSFNWDNIPSDLRSKIILAGGISENNIDEIYNNIKPQAIDLSSALESEPGKKDYKKIKSFFTKLNNLRNQ